MIRALPHILARIFGPPLLIAPARLEPLLKGLQAAMLQRGSVEVSPSSADPASPSPPGEERPRGYTISRGVATLPIHGVLVRRAGQIAPDSTLLQSYENLGRVVRSAHRDSRVRGILLDIDSPGGEAGGVFDLADQVRQAGQTKPVWAIANDDSLSAAYAIAASAERIWTTQTGALGSLGCWALHADQSAFDAHEGVHYTYIFRGARKIDAHPHAALSGEAQAAIQGEVDRLYTKLIDQVAKHRRTEPARLQATEAAVYYGEHALERGLADRLGTIDEAHAALAEQTMIRGRGQMNEGPTPTGEDLGDNVVQLRVDEAATAARAQAAEILNLCLLGAKRQPWGAELAQELIAKGASIETASRAVLERQAREDATRVIVPLDTSADQRAVNTSAELARAAAARFAAQGAAHKG
jgi:signal peptide peptidase SppA